MYDTEWLIEHDLTTGDMVEMQESLREGIRSAHNRELHFVAFYEPSELHIIIPILGLYHFTSIPKLLRGCMPVLEITVCYGIKTIF